MQSNQEAKKRRYFVAPKTLLLIAGIVWAAAGVNIFRIGLIDFVASWQHNVWYLLYSLFVFVLFTGLIFYRLVQKHYMRIVAMQEKSVPFYQFFDRKSYLIMFLMITFGLLVRSLHLLPSAAIGILYSGIGLSLIVAGALFSQKFAVELCRGTAVSLQQSEERCEKEVSHVEETDGEL